MSINSYTGGPVFTNGYVIEHEDTCIVIDSPSGIEEAITDNKLKPTHLLLTHQHFDHTNDASSLREKYGLQILMHSPYCETLIRQKEARENWHLPVQIEPFEADQHLKGQSELKIGSLDIQIFHIPGHSPDSIAFYIPSLESVFTGDTLMQGGLGRTDLPGGCHETLIQGIIHNLYPLPCHTSVLSGHGPKTTILEEKQHNPFA